MRIITGTLKGRRLSVPKNVELRPTTDRVKESMFAIIEARKGFAGLHILDLFAGSGNLTFESISRGAQRIVAVEQSPIAVQHINKTAKSLQIDTKIHVLAANVEHYLDGVPQTFDLVFADPPYTYPYIPHLIEQVLSNWLKDAGWLVLEHDLRHQFEEHPHCVFSKAYGRTIVTIFTKLPVEL